MIRIVCLSFTFFLSVTKNKQKRLGDDAFNVVLFYNSYFLPRTMFLSFVPRNDVRDVVSQHFYSALTLIPNELSIIKTYIK